MNKWRSRKFYLVLGILIVTTIMMAVPPLLSVFLIGSREPLVLLTGSEYVSVVSIVVSAYFAGNVAEKHVVKSKVTEEEGEH